MMPATTANTYETLAYSRLSLRDSGLRRGILPYNNNGIPIARMPLPQLVG